MLKECVVICRELAAKLNTWTMDQTLANHIHNFAHALDETGLVDIAEGYWAEQNYWAEHDVVEARIAARTK